MAARLDDGDDEIAETHDINVTPFIDVILVLLIIFMVAAPLATVDVAVDLPSASARPVPRPDKPIFLTLQAGGALQIGEATVARAALAGELDRQSAGDRSQRLYVRADKTVPYGELMTLMDALRQAGYLKVGLVALQGDAAP